MANPEPREIYFVIREVVCAPGVGNAGEAESGFRRLETEMPSVLASNLRDQFLQ